MQVQAPDFISHYYEKEMGPLKSLTDQDKQKGQLILKQISEKGKGFNSSTRPPAYFDWRIDVENWLREEFIRKGGAPKRKNPHYFILGTCDWLLSWYNNGAILQKELKDIDSSQITITYPDSMVSYQMHQYHILKNNKLYKESEYREYYGKVYLLNDLETLISKYGIPKGEAINGKPGSPDMYIELQIWDDIDSKDE